MSITAAILLIGACGSASRTMTVEPSIERIVWQCVVGGVSDVVLSGRSGVEERMATTGGWSLGENVRLRIDGQPRTGILAWAAAAYRVSGYMASDSSGESVQRGGNERARREVGDAGRPEHGPALPAWAAARDAEYVFGRQSGGSVEYQYRISIRGFDVRRKTVIADGHVLLTTDIYGSIGPRGELYHVRLVLDAREMGDGTRIRGTATGWSQIGDRCRLVRRIAEREIGKQLDTELLGRVQAGGIDLYRAGGIAEVLR